MAIRNFADQAILSAANEASTGAAMLVDDYKNVILSFATDGGSDAALTVKFQGSIEEDCPDFSAAQSVSNHWDYIEVVDLQDGAAIDGDTGIAVATADDYRLVEANVNGLRWICATVTARTEGEVTVKARAYYE